MPNAKSPFSLRSLAEKYNCSPQTISNLKKEGVDINNENAVRARLDRPAGESVPLTVPANSTETGLRAAIERLRQAEVAAHTDYLNALQNAPDRAGLALKGWQAILESLRKIENDNPSIEKENDNSVSREELAAVLSILFGNLKLELDSLPKRLSVSLVGRSKAEIREIVEREVERITGELYECKFL